MDTVDVVMTKLHAGGKFENCAYKVSGRPARRRRQLRQRPLASGCGWRSQRDGKVYEQKYERGIPQQQVAEMGVTDEARHQGLLQAGPDHLRDHGLQLRHASASACASSPSSTPGCTSPSPTSAPARATPSSSTGGIVSFVEYLNKSKETLHHAHLLQGRQGRRRARDRDAVERRLRRAHLHLRQQHQHPRGRHPPRAASRARSPGPSTPTPSAVGCGRT